MEPLNEKQVKKESEGRQKALAEMRSGDRMESNSLYGESRDVFYDPKTGKLMKVKTRRK